MAWNGYFEYDGNEIINATRTEQYAKGAGLHWFRPQFNNDALPFMLGHGLRYTTPMLDDAPWVDPDYNPSLDFYGVYPLDVTGIEDSTRQSTVVESLGTGGTPGRVRHGTKTVVFNCLMLARTEEGADHGMKWLRQALLGNACGAPVESACNGAEMCYLNGPPDMYLPSELSTRTYEIEWEDVSGTFVSDPEECLDEYRRSLRKVVFNTGPTVTGKREMSDGAVVWTVTFTAVAGSPYEFGVEVPIIEGFLDPNIAVPWAGGVVPAGGTIDLNGFIHDETACAGVEVQPIFDPLCPAIVPPAAPPSVPLGCYDPPANWRRRQFTIPKEFVPMWGDVVPKIDVHARKRDLRNLRLRFYADPFKLGDVSDDPCSYCGDIVISYVPKDHTLTFDASEQTVYVTSPGGSRRRADSLVFKTDGTPFEWPALTCGFGYVVTIDLPQTQAPPVVDLSLFARAV